MTADLVLRNVTLLTGRRADIVVCRGFVRHVGAPVRADETIDCSRFTCSRERSICTSICGEVQVRERGWRTGTMSAVAGGVTVVVDQPNTVPPHHARTPPGPYS